MTYDDQNIFAKIIRGEIPSLRIYEDEHTIAIMDVMPQCDGHALVLPKAGSRNILDIAPESLAATMLTAQRIARAAMQAFGADGVNVMQFNEPAAGQTVYHTHVHIIPRMNGVPLKPHAREMVAADVLAPHAAGAGSALLGGGQFALGAAIAPGVGAAGTGSPFPMAVIMLCAYALCGLVWFSLARPAQQ